MAAAQRVKLLVYDLSRGMASQMSEQFLGQRIDGIWHTGVECFGNEYFFGGGIQCARAGVFANQQNMTPVQVRSFFLLFKRTTSQFFLSSVC